MSDFGARQGLRILMVDDCEEDIFFVEKALEASGVGRSFHGVHDGEQAIQYMRGEGEYSDRKRFPFPNLILSDLKMPKIGGHELLAWLKRHDDCSVIPTIIFSSSGLPADVTAAYRAGANAYITKPGTHEELVYLIQITYSFWSHCEKPPMTPTQSCA